MKSNIETYLRLKPLLEDNDNNNNDNKKLKSKMINYEIESNQKKNIYSYSWRITPGLY